MSGEDTIQRLDGRVAVVTGSSAGIGRATALALARQGASVVVNARSADRAAPVVAEIEAAGGRAAAVVADLSEPGGAEQLIADSAAALGDVDILVNNAGHGLVAPSEDLSEDDWRRTIEVLLTAPFLLSQAAGRQMLANGGGVIVNVSSICGHVALPRRAAYTTAKHGLVGLTRTLATEWADRGVRVMTVDPAYIATDFIKGTMKSGGFDAAAIEGRTPLARLGSPEEVARVIAFLASDAASYMTGGSVMVDGGWMAYGGW
jgi:NAD(P)-dependent dehydrogenase (short-subunit alcohol dehydrogenase family)